MMTRSESKRELPADAGAQPVVRDVYDAARRTVPLITTASGVVPSMGCRRWPGTTF